MIENNIDNQINHFCWGCLYHFLGRDDLAELFFGKIIKWEESDGKETEIGNLLSNATQLILRYCISLKDQSISSKPILQELEKLISTSILNKDLPSIGSIAKECSREKADKSGRSEGKPDIDEINEGYSRDPFQEFSKKSVKINIALGCVIYLLRAYARLFGEDKNDRVYSIAKWSLNDCFQAQQFIWRIYQNSEYCHHKSAASNSDFFNVVKDEIESSYTLPEEIDNADDSIIAWNSAFFTWSIFLFVDILRANIYYQIEVFESSFYYYDIALKRLGNIAGLLNSKNSHKLVTGTLIRARFEKSKMDFDKGLLLKSIAEQLLCLKHLIVTFGNSNKDNTNINSSIDTAISFLNIEGYSHVWDKRIICRIFDFGNKSFLPEHVEDAEIDYFLDCILERGTWSDKSIIKPSGILEQFVDDRQSEIEVIIDHGTQKLIAEILARIGFTLFILRIDIVNNKLLTSEYFYYWLKPFFMPTHIEKECHSAMASYSLTIISQSSDKESEESDSIIFDDSLDRQLALRLREYIAQERKNAENNYSEYINLLDATTQNIGNLLTIPRRNQRLLMRQGYIDAWNKNTLNRNIENKLVILRRWQSFNPKLPRHGKQRLPGGGYLLIWQNKGIAIDPGYDFIQNLYDEGFSLGDIHAVIVTHSHPDHDDDLSTLLTMLHEWNEYQEKHGQPYKERRKLDLFLNESSYRKFATWVHSEKKILGRITLLPLLVWDKDSKSQVIKGDSSLRVGPRRGSNVKLDLTGLDGYNLELEIIPAWHDDVINSTGAVGLIFHLFPPIEDFDENIKDRPDAICKLGYTGDSGAYGIAGDLYAKGNLSQMYKDCHILLAHLGDARLREISTIIKKELGGGGADPIPLTQLLHDIFCTKHGRDEFLFDGNKLSNSKVAQILHLLTALQLIDNKFTEVKFQLDYKLSEDEPFVKDTVLVLINTLLNLLEGGESIDIPRGSFGHDALRVFYKAFNYEETIVNKCTAQVDKAVEEIDNVHKKIISIGKNPKTYSIQEALYLLMTMLISSCNIPWNYKYHLGIKGIESLFGEFYLTAWKNKVEHSGIFIVGELPEELSSYRHRIARWLNKDIVDKIENKNNIKRPHGDPKSIYAITGDIGLHIRLAKDQKYDPKIRCDYCNFNYETMISQKAYSKPSDIRETVIKAMESRMIYLCTNKDHHPQFNGGSYNLYLFKPDIKRL